MWYDHLGNTRVTFRADAPDLLAIDYAADYYPYGKILREYKICDPNRFLSTFHERDAETGYDNRGARLYDSEIGRFLGVDPLAGKFKGHSPYNYVLGNPISLVDPEGEEPAEPDCCPPDYSLGFAYMHHGKEGMQRNLQGKYASAAGALTGAAILTTGAVAPAAGANYLKRTGKNLLFEAGESLIFSENNDLSDIDYFDVLNPIKGFWGSLANASFNVKENEVGRNSAPDMMVELLAGEAGGFLGRKLKGRGLELTQRAESLENYNTLYPGFHPTTGRRNTTFSVSREVQRASDFRAGTRLIRRGENQGAVAGIFMENLLKKF